MLNLVALLTAITYVAGQSNTTHSIYSIQSTVQASTPRRLQATDTLSLTPITFSGLSARSNVTCGHSTQGTAYCWGDPRSPILPPSLLNSDFPIPITGLANVIQVTTGQSHACAVTLIGSGFCWGSGQQGKLGTGSTNDTTVPTRIYGSYTWVSLSAGIMSTCGIFLDGSVQRGRCWGANHQGQIGSTDASSSLEPNPFPVLVERAGNYRAISVGNVHACAAIGFNGYCWGYGLNGQVGTGNGNGALTPERVVGLDDNVYTIAAGEYHSCAITLSSTVYCWGEGLFGRLGGGSADGQNSPTQVPGLSNIASISLGDANTCAVSNSGQLYCWGSNHAGVLGNGAAAPGLQANTPVLVQLPDVTAVYTGYSHACAQITAKAVYCWGRNSKGQLGVGNLSAQINTFAPMLLTSSTALTITHSTSRVSAPWSPTKSSAAAMVIHAISSVPIRTRQMQIAINSEVGCLAISLLGDKLTRDHELRCRARDSLTTVSFGKLQVRGVPAFESPALSSPVTEDVCPDLYVRLDIMSDNVPCFSRACLTCSATLYFRFSKGVSDVNQSALATVGSGTGVGDITQLGSSGYTWTATANCDPAVGDLSIAIANPSTLVHGEHINNADAVWPPPSPELYLYLTNCTGIIAMPWASADVRGVVSLPGCVAVRSMPASGFVITPVGPLTVMAQGSAADVVQAPGVIASTGVIWLEADEQHGKATTAATYYRWWRRVLAVEEDASVWVLAPYDRCKQALFVAPQEAALAATVWHDFRVLDQRVASDSGAVKVTMLLELTAGATMPALVDLVVYAVRGSTSLVCSQLQWQTGSKTLQCQLPGMTYGAYFMDLHFMGSVVRAVQRVMLPQAPVLRGIVPAEMTPAVVAGATRTFTVDIFGEYFSVPGDLGPTVTVHGVPCTQLQRVNFGHLRCTQLAVMFNSTSNSQQLPIKVVLPRPSDITEAESPEASRTATLSSAMVVRTDTSPPVASILPWQLAVGTSGMYKLEGMVFDDVSSFSALTIAVLSIRAVPASLLANFSCPAVDSSMPAPDFEVNTTGISAAGTITVGLAITDDAGLSMQGSLTVTVINTVFGEITPYDSRLAVQPFNTPSDTICANITFARSVAGLSADGLQAQAGAASGLAVVPDHWFPANVALYNVTEPGVEAGTKYILCINVSDLQSATWVSLTLPLNAGHDATDLSIPTSALDIAFTRDTQAPILNGLILCVPAWESDSEFRFARGVPIACSMIPSAAVDDAQASGLIMVTNIRTANASDGEIRFAHDIVSSWPLSSSPQLTGMLTREGWVDILVTLEDLAGNVGHRVYSAFVWAPAVWQPVITGIQPPVLPPAGGQVRITGGNFTALTSSVEGVQIGGQACTGVQSTAIELICTVGRGIGAHLALTIHAPGNINVTRANVLAYQVPTITGVAAQPGSTLTLLPSGGALASADAAIRSQRVQILCEACGWQAADVTGIYVGGVKCDVAVVHDSSGQVECQLLPSQHGAMQLLDGSGRLASGTEPDLHVNVTICVADQCSAAANLSVLGKPVLVGFPGITATGDGHWLVQPGTVVSVSGYNLGRASADIVGVSVGGVACPSVDRLDDKLLVAMPAAPASGPAELLGVRVTTTAGWTSSVAAATKVSYQAAYNSARTPAAAPVLTALARVPAVPVNWHVQLRIPPSPELQWRPVTAVMLRWRLLGAAGWPSAATFVVAEFRSVVNASQSADGLQYGVADVAIQANLTLAQLPYTEAEVQAALVNVGGSGPWSAGGVSIRAALPQTGIISIKASRVASDSGTVQLLVNVAESAELSRVPVTQIEVYYASLGQLRRISSLPRRGLVASSSLSQVLLQNGTAAAFQASALPVTTLASSRSLQYTVTLQRVTPSPVQFTAVLTTDAGRLASAAVSKPLYEQCDVRQYLSTYFADTDPDAVLCVPCPEGAWCGGGTYDAVLPVAGWYRLSWTPQALSLAPCPIPAACPGVPMDEINAVGTNRTAATELTAKYLRLLNGYMIAGSRAAVQLPASSTDGPNATRCTAGYQGTLCRSCRVGYSQSSTNGTCRECRAIGVQVLLLILGVLVVVVGLSYLVLSTIRTGSDEDQMLTSGLKKLIVSHNQQISLAIGFRFAWPGAIAGLLEGANQISDIGESVIATDCMVSSQGLTAFRLRMIGVVVAPWAALLVALGIWIALHAEAKHTCCTRAWRGCKAAVSGSANAAPAVDQRSVKPSALSATSISMSHLVHWQYVKQYMTVTVIILCFALHTSVTKASLRQFSCVTLPNDPTGRQVLADDYDVPCNSAENAAWIYGMGGPGFVLYGLGMPAALWYVMWRRRDSLQDEHTLARLGFLYVSYRPHAWWFEPVMMVRKAVLALISVNLAPLGLSMQAYAGLVLIFLALLLHMNLRPMASAYLQGLEQVSLVLSVLTLIGGLFLSASGSVGMSVIVSIAIVGGNAGFMAYLVYKLVALYVEEQKHRSELLRRLHAKSKALSKRWSTSTRQMLRMQRSSGHVHHDSTRPLDVSGHKPAGAREPADELELAAPACSESVELPVLPASASAHAGARAESQAFPLSMQNPMAHLSRGARIARPSALIPTLARRADRQPSATAK